MMRIVATVVLVLALHFLPRLNPLKVVSFEILTATLSAFSGR